MGESFTSSPPNFDDAAHQIDRQIAQFEDRPFTLHLQLMPQCRAHAREQLFHAERLGDVIVGAEIERLDLGNFVAAARQHHDRNILAPLTNLAEQLEPLHVGKAEIENDEVGLVSHQIESGLRVGRVDGLIALRAQSHAQQFADRRLVVDDKDLERR